MEAKARKAAEREARRAAAGAGAGAAGREGGVAPARRARARARPPPDFVHTFAGNSDEDFRVGLSFSRSACTPGFLGQRSSAGGAGSGSGALRLYAPFYASDILLASPLGLRRILGGEGDAARDRDTDFLSSIEVCCVDAAEALLAQNWEHVEGIFSALNALPRAVLPGTDFSRVREWALAGAAAHWRQTIVLGAWVDPARARLARRGGGNCEGGCVRRVGAGGPGRGGGGGWGGG